MEKLDLVCKQGRFEHFFMLCDRLDYKEVQCYSGDANRRTCVFVRLEYAAEYVR
jgi:hypothetical protein